MTRVAARAWPAIFCVALTVACAGGERTGASPHLRASMQREVELPEAAPVASADGAVRARVAGRVLAPLERTPDHTYFARFDIGARQPVECHVFDEERDPATTLVKMSENVFASTAKTRKVDHRDILSVGAGSAGPHPYLSFDWLAKIDGVSYQVKQKFAARGDRALYCLHDETGYAKTFDRFFTGFLSSLEVEEEGADAIYHEVVVLTISGNQVGYQAVTVTRTAAGNYRAHTRSASIIPSAADQAMASDDQLVEFSRPDGSVINQVWASSDGKDLTQLDLKPNDDGGWTVTGQMQGKAVSEHFAAKLVSVLEENRMIMRVARGELGEQRYLRWLGTVSPGKPLEHVMTKSGASSVSMSAGPVKVDVEVDERAPRRAVLHVGRLDLVMERVYLDGRL